MDRTIVTQLIGAVVIGVGFWQLLVLIVPVFIEWFVNSPYYEKIRGCVWGKSGPKYRIDIGRTREAHYTTLYDIISYYLRETGVPAPYTQFYEIQSSPIEYQAVAGEKVIKYKAAISSYGIGAGEIVVDGVRIFCYLTEKARFMRIDADDRQAYDELVYKAVQLHKQRLVQRKLYYVQGPNWSHFHLTDDRKLDTMFHRPEIEAVLGDILLDAMSNFSSRALTRKKAVIAMHGPKGTGKTSVAYAFAASCDASIYRMSHMTNKTDFEYFCYSMSEQPAVVLWDEFDMMTGVCDVEGKELTPDEKQMRALIHTFLDGYYTTPLIVFLTTNNFASWAPTIKRRCDYQLHVDEMRGPEMRRMLDHCGWAEVAEVEGLGGHTTADFAHFLEVRAKTADDVRAYLAGPVEVA